MKKLLVYIIEFIKLLVLVSIFIFSIVYSKVITITFCNNFTAVLIIGILGTYFIINFSRIVNMGLRALIDCLFNKKVELEGKITSCHPVYMSSLMEKLDKDRTIVSKEVFEYVIKSGKKYVLLHSPVFLKLEEGEKYSFIIGKYSRVILEYS